MKEKNGMGGTECHYKTQDLGETYNINKSGS